MFIRLLSGGSKVNIMMMTIIYKVNQFDYGHHQCILEPYF